VQRVTEEESRKIIRTAIDNGINFLDNSWDYNIGLSETRMRKAMRDAYREKVFLSKIPELLQKNKNVRLQQKTLQTSCSLLDYGKHRSICERTLSSPLVSPVLRARKS
jgi:predicted aldo/keto reductase-like oxidoreductase